MKTTIRRAFDHNRGLARPVAAAHAAAALVTPVTRWLAAPPRRHTLRPLAYGAGAAMLLLPLDGALGRPLMRWGEALGGDVRRELLTLQQFGGLGSLVLTTLLIALLDPARRARLLDLAAAAVLTSLAVLAAKMLIGRPRPKFDDPGVILGPFAAYPLGPGEGVRHAWEFWGGISSDLWSMPSSHTSAAAVLGVFLALTYARLRLVMLGWVGLVALSRVLFAAHWPSDVVLGAAAGYTVGHAAVTGAWGQRLARALKPAQPTRDSSGG
jgi:membrane-associated phospholipid phosphatase